MKHPPTEEVVQAAALASARVAGDGGINTEATAEKDDAMLGGGVGGGGSHDERFAEGCLMVGRYAEGLVAQTIGAREGASLLVSLASGLDAMWSGDESMADRQQLAFKVRAVLIAFLARASASDERDTDETRAVAHAQSVPVANALLRALARDGRLEIRMNYFRVQGSR